MIENVVGWKYVVPDGNCGFRAVAAAVRLGKEGWQSVRKTLLTTLSSDRALYLKYACYQSVEWFDSLRVSLDSNDSPCGIQHYMQMPSTDKLILNFINQAYT